VLVLVLALVLVLEAVLLGTRTKDEPEREPDTLWMRL
jgi:hypothetical protein